MSNWEREHERLMQREHAKQMQQQHAEQQTGERRMSEAWQALMMKLYDPERDGYESGSEGDFPVEERALERIEALERENAWVRVAHFVPDVGLEWISDADYPVHRQWVLIESESATGIKYEARKHDSGTWPSFGIRWKPIEQESGG